jgi:hypothetical protein
MAIAVAIIQGPTITTGCAEFIASLIPIIVAGSKVMQEVFNAKKVHIA